MMYSQRRFIVAFVLHCLLSTQLEGNSSRVAYFPPRRRQLKGGNLQRGMLKSPLSLLMHKRALSLSSKEDFFWANGNGEFAALMQKQNVFQFFYRDGIKDLPEGGEKNHRGKGVRGTCCKAIVSFLLTFC